MQLEAHLAVGWLAGNLVPRSDRRIRALAMFAALAPDLDGVPYLLGPDIYARTHHIYGHNVFAGLLITILCTALAGRRRWLAGLVVGVAGFVTHWVGDYYLSGWPLMTFWPLSRDEVMFRPRIALDHPINHVLSFASLIFLAASIWWWRRTVFESVWPAMDRLLVGLTQPRTLHCTHCQSKTAQRCHRCGQPLCLRHAKLTPRLQIRCASCPP
jgi:hypothetical protein